MQKYLIETSAWIESLRVNGKTQVKQTVQSLMENAEIAICYPVLLELFNGAKGHAEIKFLSELQQTITILETTEEVWEKSIAYAKLLRSKGKTIPNIDILIKATADYYQYQIFSIDSDFAQMEMIL